MVAKHTKAQHRAFLKEVAAIILEGFPLRDKASASKGIILATGEMARRMGTTPSTVIKRVRAARDLGLGHILDDAEAKRKANLRQPLKIKPVNAEARRSRVVLLTAAQDETELHEGFWQNLTAYAGARNAEIMVGGFTYQKGLFEDHSVRKGVYHREIVPLLRPVETALAPGLVWCGHANILPTAAAPLSGWQTHGGAASIIIPHAKIALESVPRMPGAPAKIAHSTGVCTLPNYVKRNAGMKAEWHHTIGFAVVEIAADGTCWTRTISAEKDGTFRDLDWLVKGGKATVGHRVEAITWGDIHHEKIDPTMTVMAWGIDAAGRKVGRSSMLDALRPREQHFHDLIDFTARNHHNRADPIFLATMHAARTESVAVEIAAAARWLKAASRPWCRSVVINSNHDDALGRWLRSTDAARDPANSAYWHELNARWHEAAQAADHGFHPFDHALREAGAKVNFKFVRAGESHVICADTGAIECGLHGNQGSNGARGSLPAFARMAPRTNTAHSHSPGVRDGAYQGGTNSSLWLGYNTSPTSWAHADIVTHSSGKRQIVVKNEKGWRL